MTVEKKQQVITLLKQVLETIQNRTYNEIAEIPTEDLEDFQVKYSLIHGDLEGIFTVVGKNIKGELAEATNQITLSCDFDEDPLHNGSATTKEQIEKDLASAGNYINAHID